MINILFPLLKVILSTQGIVWFQMVVVSGGWVKSVVYPNCGDVIATSKMAAKAVLICRPNSHPFQVISPL
jgi:hypothetical protein